MIRDGITGDLMPWICDKTTNEEYSEEAQGLYILVIYYIKETIIVHRLY